MWQMGKAFTSVFYSAVTLCKWAPQVVHGEMCLLVC